MYHGVENSFHGLLGMGISDAIFKRPLRDAGLYSGERGERKRVYWLPHFLLHIAWQPLGEFASNLANVCSSPVTNFLIWCHDISTNQRSHMTKNMLFKEVCLSR